MNNDTEYKYYYNVGNDIRLKSNVKLSKIERGFYMKKVRGYGNLLKSVDVEIQKDNSVIITVNLKTPHIFITERPEVE